MSFVFVQCSKKTTDGMVDKTKEKMSKVDPALAWRAGAPAAGPARDIKLGDYTSFDLDNGLKVIIVENHKLPKVSYQLSLNNDPILEGDQVGYVSFAGTMMGHGTSTKSKADIDASIDYIGANLNTSSSGIYASSLKKHSDKLLAIMTDVLYNPSFPKTEFDKLKTQALSGLATSKTDPNTMASNLASVLNYGKEHPYGEVRTEESVNNISLDNCMQYYNTYFKPNNAFLIVVGDVNTEEAKTQAKKYFGKWKSGKIPTSTYKKPNPIKGANVSFANKDGAVQSVINITYPVDLKPGQKDLVKARVMNNILGGGIFSGRLMQNLREDKAYTYGARSRLSSDELVGDFVAFASVRNAVTDSSVTEFIHEMKRLVNEPVSAEDLQLVKNSMTGSFARSLESAQTIARFARNTYKHNLSKDYYQNYLKRLEAVSIDDVSAMAKKYIRPENANIIIAGSKDDVAHTLKKFDADGVVDFYDAFGTKLEDVANVLPTGLNGMTVINDYFESLGGMKKLKDVKTMVSKMTAEVMGQKMNMEMGQKDNKLFYMEMSMGGNVMQEQRFNGVKGKIGGMGQNQVVTEGDQFDSMKDQAVIIGQLNYLDGKHTINLKGIENVGDQKAYKLEIIKPGGKKSYEYYSVQNNLLIKSTSTQEVPGSEPATITTEYEDYKEVSGVQFPHKITLIGAMPFPLVMIADSYTVNGTIPTEKFNVD
ncbi:MAG: pitrilysin family protein [Saprospiraceae bacterium]